MDGAARGFIFWRAEILLTFRGACPILVVLARDAAATKALRRGSLKGYRTMANDIHDSWVLQAEKSNLVRFEDAEVTIRDAEKGTETKVPFKAAVFTIETPEQAAEAFKLAEADRKTDKDGNLKANPVASLLAYAYGLQCRAYVRSANEPQDPDAAIKKVAAVMFKTKMFPTMELALTAARAMKEQPAEQ
jgi:hypothetical protein